MRKILLFAGILLSGLSVSAQQFSGTYKNGTDSLFFSNGKVIFRISGFGGLSTAKVGEGDYEIDGDFLFVHTTEYSGDKTSFQALNGSRKDTCVVKTVSTKNYPLQGILVEARTKSGKLISGKVTENDGKTYFSPCDKITSISISSLGYNSISFEYASGKDYLVRLAENDVIENQTAVFQLHTIDDETFTLLMLTDNLNLNKDRAKELRKIEKKVRKSNVLSKRFKKIFVPTYSGKK